MRMYGICGIKNVAYLRVGKNIRLEILISLVTIEKSTRYAGISCLIRYSAKVRIRINTLFLRPLFPIWIPLDKGKA